MLLFVAVKSPGHRSPFAEAVQELCRPLLLSKKEKRVKAKEDDTALRRVGLSGLVTGALAVPLVMGGRLSVCATLRATVRPRAKQRLPSEMRWAHLTLY